MAATYRLTVGESAHDVAVDERDGRFVLTIDGESVEAAFVAGGVGPASLLTVSEQAGAVGNQPTQVKAPLTGSIVDVVVAEGDAVTKGQVVVVIESMKMNNELRAPRDGVVAQVHVAKGDRVERNTPLVTIR
jgi:biotin carboxyl carrier protein